MEDKIKFPANVILIDVAFLNEVVYGAKELFWKVSWEGSYPMLTCRHG